LQPWYADDQFEPTKSLRDKVVEMVANARYGIYDLSWWRPDEQSAWKMPHNVLIELGMAIALNRPVLLLRHAENRASGLSLPTCLDSISQRIVEFSGGPTLKHALEERLPQWLDVPPERAWWAHYCLFGERTCTYRETYPQIIQCGQKTICCHIADGQDIDRPDFRSLIEDELGRYSDISFDYLDALLPTAGYDFQLCTYCQIVRSTPFAIYRITPKTNAETFIAIGMSIALEKQFKCEIPKFIFTTDARSVPSLLAGYEVVEATKTREQQKHLRKFIPVIICKVRESVWKPGPLPFVDLMPYHTEQLKPDKKDETDKPKQEESDIAVDQRYGLQGTPLDPRYGLSQEVEEGQVNNGGANSRQEPDESHLFPKQQTPPVSSAYGIEQRRQIFIASSQKDKRYLQQLQAHFAGYERDTMIDVWNDAKIVAGRSLQEEIKKSLSVTRVAILLISADFLASNFIEKNILPPLLLAAEHEGAIILPVIIGYCIFEDTALQPFQTFNTPSKPLSAQKASDRDILWADLVRYVITLLKNA
jgi:hypothetical protein